MSKTLRELREEMTDEQVKDVLSQFNVFSFDENESFIIFPTCCHNLEGGSPKLYYYKNTHLFKCYTQCNETFDIFTLLIKMYKLRNQDISLRQAVAICDLGEENDIDFDYGEQEDYQYMLKLEKATTADKLAPLQVYDKKILETRFTFDLDGVKSWLDEGISVDALKRFDIRYDPVDQCIVIPNYDVDGNLIGIRGRYLDEEVAKKYGKYRPVSYNGQCLRYPTGRFLYGLYQNQEAIKRKQTVVIFEGEKSVLHYNDYYKDNVAVATLGKNITSFQISTLIKLGVKRVVLAYDADYETEFDLMEKKKEYEKLGRILSKYFNVSILLDWDLQLQYKSSPIEGGKEYFEKLLKQRVVL